MGVRMLYYARYHHEVSNTVTCQSVALGISTDERAARCRTP
jgi:hypothetical protein